MGATVGDRWASGRSYEAYVGRWSRQVAPRFLAWLSVAPNRRWVDVGCGTGILTATILREAEPAAVTGVDPSDPFLQHARQAVTDPRVTFLEGNAADTGVADASADAVVSGLVLNFVPDSAAALAEAGRIATPGGTIAAYVWDYDDGMQMMRRFWDTAGGLDPEARRLDESIRFSIASPDGLSTAFTAAGLDAVEVTDIVVPTVFQDFDDLWTPFLGATGPAPVYVASLDDARRQVLRDRYREAVAPRADGSIHLTARAWAVRGRNPG